MMYSKVPLGISIQELFGCFVGCSVAYHLTAPRPNLLAALSSNPISQCSSDFIVAAYLRLANMTLRVTEALANNRPHAGIPEESHSGNVCMCMQHHTNSTTGTASAITPTLTHSRQLHSGLFARSPIATKKKGKGKPANGQPRYMKAPQHTLQNTKLQTNVHSKWRQLSG